MRQLPQVRNVPKRGLVNALRGLTGLRSGHRAPVRAVQLFNHHDLVLGALKFSHLARARVALKFSRLVLEMEVPRYNLRALSGLTLFALFLHIGQASVALRVLNQFVDRFSIILQDIGIADGLRELFCHCCF